MVLPGFQDAHCHLAESGYQLTLCDLSDCDSPDAYPGAIAAYAAAHPDRPVIAGGGWAMSDFPGGVGAREVLDAVVSDRPVILYSRDYHGAWVNTRALEAAGITRDTADPRGGRIERDRRRRARPGRCRRRRSRWRGDDAGAGRRRAGRRDAGGAGVLPQPGHHRLPGRPRRRAVAAGLRAAGRLRRADAARARQPGLGRRSATSGSSPSCWSAGAAGTDRAAGLRQRQVLPRWRGGEPHRRHARAVPATATASPTGEYGVDQYDRRELERYVGLCDAEGFGVHIHASATGPCARRWTRSRRPRRPTAAATRATSWPTSSSLTTRPAPPAASWA